VVEYDSDDTDSSDEDGVAALAEASSAAAAAAAMHKQLGNDCAKEASACTKAAVAAAQQAGFVSERTLAVAAATGASPGIDGDEAKAAAAVTAIEAAVEAADHLYEARLHYTEGIKLLRPFVPSSTGCTVAEDGGGCGGGGEGGGKFLRKYNLQAAQDVAKVAVALLCNRAAVCIKLVELRQKEDLWHDKRWHDKSTDGSAESTKIAQAQDATDVRQEAAEAVDEEAAEAVAFVVGVAVIRELEDIPFPARILRAGEFSKLGEGFFDIKYTDDDENVETGVTADELRIDQATMAAEAAEAVAMAAVEAEAAAAVVALRTLAELAVSDCVWVLQLESDCVKALFRQAHAKRLLAQVCYRWDEIGGNKSGDSNISASISTEAEMEEAMAIAEAKVADRRHALQLLLEALALVDRIVGPRGASASGMYDPDYNALEPGNKQVLAEKTSLVQAIAKLLKAQQGAAHRVSWAEYSTSAGDGAGSGAGVVKSDKAELGSHSAYDLEPTLIATNTAPARSAPAPEPAPAPAPATSTPRRPLLQIPSPEPPPLLWSTVSSAPAPAPTQSPGYMAFIRRNREKDARRAAAPVVAIAEGSVGASGSDSGASTSTMNTIPTLRHYNRCHKAIGPVGSSRADTDGNSFDAKRPMRHQMRLRRCCCQPPTRFRPNPEQPYQMLRLNVPKVTTLDLSCFRALVVLELSSDRLVTLPLPRGIVRQLRSLTLTTPQLIGIHFAAEPPALPSSEAKRSPTKKSGIMKALHSCNGCGLRICRPTDRQMIAKELQRQYEHQDKGNLQNEGSCWCECNWYGPAPSLTVLRLSCMRSLRSIGLEAAYCPILEHLSIGGYGLEQTNCDATLYQLTSSGPRWSPFPPPQQHYRHQQQLAHPPLAASPFRLLLRPWQVLQIIWQQSQRPAVPLLLKSLRSIELLPSPRTGLADTMIDESRVLEEEGLPYPSSSIDESRVLLASAPLLLQLCEGCPALTSVTWNRKHLRGGHNTIRGQSSGVAACDESTSGCALTARPKDKQAFDVSSYDSENLLRLRLALLQLSTNSTNALCNTNGGDGCKVGGACNRNQARVVMPVAIRDRLLQWPLTDTAQWTISTMHLVPPGQSFAEAGAGGLLGIGSLMEGGEAAMAKAAGSALLVSAALTIALVLPTAALWLRGTCAD
jgi:hypothetical protein